MQETCCREPASQIVIRPARHSEGGCVFCEYPDYGTDVMVIHSRRGGGLLIRLCYRHRKEIGAA